METLHNCTTVSGPRFTTTEEQELALALSSRSPRLLLALLLLALADTTQASDPNPLSDTLTGDWLGIRTALRDHGDRKSTRLNSSHLRRSRMPSSA